MADMRRKGATRSSFGGLVWFGLTRIGLPIALLYGLLWWRIDAEISRLLQPLQQVGEVQRGSTFFTLSGEAGVSSLSIAQSFGGPRLRAGPVSVQTPNLWWLIRSSVFGAPENLPRRLGIRITNLVVEGLPSEPESGVVGAFSAMPFEAAGCNAASFSKADLASMGLPETDTVLSAEYEHSDAGIISFNLQLVTPGAGRMEARMGLALANSSAVRFELLPLARLVSLSLVFEDLGFVEARNGWCTDRVTTSLADFNRVHTDGVRALLRTFGVQPDADLLSAYSKFAKDGGELRIEARPATAAAPMQLLTMGREAQFQALSPVMRVTGAAPVRFVFASAQPMTLREQQLAQQIAKARIEDGVPLDPVLADIVAEPPRIPVPQPPKEQIPLPARDGRIAYADLGPYLGREIEVTSLWGSRRRGVLKDFAQARMILRLPLHEGGFDLTVLAETIIEVRVLDAAAIQPDSTTDLTDAQAN